jgi:Neugrin
MITKRPSLVSTKQHLMVKRSATRTNLMPHFLCARLNLQHRTASSLQESVRAKLASIRKSKTPPNTQPLPPRKRPKAGPTPEAVLKHRASMKASFPSGWNPPRKISREAMEGLRTLHVHDPSTYSTPVLADKFKISPEAVRRILRSRWEPSEERKKELLERERKAKLERKLEGRRQEWEEAKKALELQQDVGRRRKQKDGLELT